MHSYSFFVIAIVIIIFIFSSFFFPSLLLNCYCYALWTGLTGDVHMNENGDRLPYFLVWDMGPDLTFRIVTQVKYDVLPNGSVFIVS